MHSINSEQQVLLGLIQTTQALQQNVEGALQQALTLQNVQQEKILQSQLAGFRAELKQSMALLQTSAQQFVSEGLGCALTEHQQQLKQLHAQEQQTIASIQQLQLRTQKQFKWLSWKLYAGVGFVVLLLFAFLWYQMYSAKSELGVLRAQIELQKQYYSQAVQSGEFSVCGEQGLLCVKTLPEFGQYGKDYYVISTAQAKSKKANHQTKLKP